MDYDTSLDTSVDTSLDRSLTASVDASKDKPVEIPYGKPFIGKEEEEAVLRVLRSGWLTTAGEALAFEKEFGEFLSRDSQGGSTARTAPYCVLVNSNTSGLHLSLEALCPGLANPKQEQIVLVPSYTFTATAEVVRYLGGSVVFVDVKPGTFLMDLEKLALTMERLSRGLPAYPPRSGQGEGFGPRGAIRGIIPVHYGGLPCDMEAIMSLAAEYNAGVIEDAAHSFPSAMPNGAWAGDASDLGVFSFYANKTITTGEGGMVVTRNKALADRISMMRSHGIDRTVWNRYTDTGASWYYEVLAPGYKYNLPDILAAIGRVQLTRAMDFLEKRTRIARIYDEAFAAIPGLIIPPTGFGDARHIYPLQIDADVLSISRNSMIDELKQRGIGVSVHFIPLHIMPYYAKQYKLESGDFPESLKSYQREISLPIWPGMTDEQIFRVVEVVCAIAQEYKR